MAISLERAGGGPALEPTQRRSTRTVRRRDRDERRPPVAQPARREQPELDGAWTYEFRGCLGDEPVRRTLRRRALAASLNANAKVPRPLDAPYRRVERPMTFLFRWRPLCLFPDSRRRNWYAQQTERGGFEPPMDRKAHTGFRDRRILPGDVH